MTRDESERSFDVETALARLSALSFVAHRDALAVLPAIQPHGDVAMLAWLAASFELFTHDRDCGKAFIRGSRLAEEVSEAVQPWTEQARTFTRWRGSARALQGFMDNLPSAFGTLGRSGQRRWAEIGLLWCGRHMESGVAFFTTSVKDLAGHQGVVGIEGLHLTAEELFESRHLMLATYLRGGLRVRNLLGHQALLPWALRGADIFQAGRMRGEAYFRLESEESLSQLLETMAGYRTREHLRLIEMLLHVWLGREVEIKESAWSPEQGRPFVEIDAGAIHLPVALPNREEALLASLHAGAHLPAGTFDREALADLAGLDAKPGAIKLTQVWEALLAPYVDDLPRFLLCFDLCEDLRVDARLGRAVPNYLRRVVRLAESTPTVVPDAQAYQSLALATLRMALRTSGNDIRLDIADALRPLIAVDASVADSFRAAQWLYGNGGLPSIAEDDLDAAYLPARGPNLSRMLTAEGKQGEGAGEGGEHERNQSVPRPQQGADEDRTETSRDGATATPGEDVAGSLEQQSRAKRQRRAQGKIEAQPANKRGRPYPEWDYRESRYKRDWAWVQERDLAESNAAEALRLTTQHARTLKQLKRAMQAQKPTRIAPQRRQLEGEEIDIEAAVAFVAERHAGQAPDASVYKRRLPRQRDTSVILLADLSTSIMQLVPHGAGRLVDRVRAGILLFAESLEVVGDAYSIAGFCSKYRDNVTYYTIKDFEEPLSAKVRHTVGGLSGRLATRMGAAIRHAVTRFDGVESRRRLLLILSDGRPEDYDDGGDRRYLHEDTRMAVKEAVVKGVHPFCITVDTLGTEYLPQIFGKGHYLVLDQINSLPAKLPEIYLKLRR